MIKKSLRAYITRRQQKLFVLLDRKMLRVFFLQAFKHEVNGGLKFRVVLAGFRRIYHFKQRRKVFLILRGFVPDVADKGAVKKPFRLLMIGKALK